MDQVYFKSINGVRDTDLTSALNSLTLSVSLDPVTLEFGNSKIDVETSDPAGFTAEDREAIINAVEAIDGGLGAISFEKYVEDKKQEIDDKTEELIDLGHSHSGVHYKLDVVSQHNADALGGHMTDNIIELMYINRDAFVDFKTWIKTCYEAIQTPSYPAQVSTTAGGFTSFANHTAYMAFKNDLLSRVRTVRYGGQGKRQEVDAVTYGDFAGVDAVNDDRT